MSISQSALEEAILTLLVFSDEGAPILTVKVPNANIFTTRVNRIIANAAIEYATKYGTAIGGQIEYILEAELRRGPEGQLLGQIIKTLREQSTQVQPNFVLAELDRFIEVQKFSSSLQDALDALDMGELEKAKEAVYQGTTTSKFGTSGIWLNDSKKMLSDLDESDSEFFSSGVPVLDNRGLRPARKTITIIVAAAKMGKSWYLVENAKAGLQFGKRVLYITCELSEKKVARRLVQSIFALTKDEALTLQTAYFVQGQSGAQINFNNIARESVIQKRREVEQKLNAWSGKRLFIKEFPTGTLSTKYFKMYLDYLEKNERFIPDLVIIDYADLMEIDSSMLRVDTGRVYRDLRGIAVERDVAMVSASQGNRDSETAKVVDRKNVAEDWSKIGTVDNVITYSRTPEEKKLGLARLLVAAARDAADRYLVLISQAYEIGAFCLDSILMNSSIAEAVKAASTSE